MDVLTDRDFSETALLQHSKCYTTLPGGVAPTTALVNATKVRFASSFGTVLTGGQFVGHVLEVDGTLTAGGGGGGGTSKEQNPVFEFPAPGDYPVTLTVTDNDGIKTTVAYMVTVQPDTVKGLTANIAGFAGMTGILGISRIIDFTGTNLVGAGSMTAVLETAAQITKARIEIYEGATLRATRFIEPLIPVVGNRPGGGCT